MGAHNSRKLPWPCPYWQRAVNVTPLEFQLVDQVAARVHYFRFIAVLIALATANTSAAFVGSGACRDCHSQEYENWQGSHHDLAMQLPSADTVLGDFNNARFVYNGITSTFYRDGDKFMVRTDGESGALEDFEVAYVFGVYPLQQYLLPLSRGRLQALNIAWDARPKAAGGQRWYHLYPEENIVADDPLHWTGPYHNWNTRCAECHSTNVVKNYNAITASFTTTFDEIDVGCESCHGPGEQHIELVTADKLDGAANGGFPIDLSQRGSWAFKGDDPIARRTQPLDSDAQIDNCARCHSRRGTLGDYHYGADLLDTHRLSLPQTPLYHPDGQILDEVYVYGSFVQSKMHMAGVVCSNCHEPHSMQLRLPDNAVCSQCHAPATYDTPAHHHHPVTSSGALCANCHMPETTYMGVDPRRDHSMRVPRPDLSMVIGVPNACNQCHQEEDANWSLAALREWGVRFRDTATHPARAFHSFESGDDRAIPKLAEIAADTNSPPIWRATAMEALGRVGGRDAMQTVATILYDDDPLIRTSTVRSLAFLPPPQRLQLLTPLLDDPITAVRLEVAVALAPVPLEQIAPAQANQLAALFAEYERIMGMHADMPSVLMQLGIFRLARGNPVGAEKAYRDAIALNYQLIPAYLNLADLLRREEREDEARGLLKKALQVAPDNGAALHALGLLETRSGDKTLALEYLGRAAAVETTGTRHRFVYAIALHDLGQPGKAIEQLQALLRASPNNQEVLLALANYSAAQGQRDRARGYVQQLIKLSPGNPNYQQLYQQLTQ